MDALWSDILPTIKSLCLEWYGFKVWPVLLFRYESANPLDDAFKSFDAHLPVFHSVFLYNQPELYANRTSPYDAGLLRLAERLLAANAKFIRGKSGLVLAEIYFLNLNVARFAPLSGSKYTPLLKYLQKKKAIVNVQNKDERCFAYAIAFALYPIAHENNPCRPQKYGKYDEREGLDDIVN